MRGRIAAVLLLVSVCPAWADRIVASVEAVNGSVTSSSGGGQPFTKLSQRGKVSPGTTIRVGAESEVMVLLLPGCTLVAGPESEVSIGELELDPSGGHSRKIRANVTKGKAAIVLERFFSGRSDIRLTSSCGEGVLGSCGFAVVEAAQATSSLFAVGGKHSWAEANKSIELHDGSFLRSQLNHETGQVEPITGDPGAEACFEFGIAAVIRSVGAKLIDPSSCPLLNKLGIGAGPSDALGNLPGGIPFNPANVGHAVLAPTTAPQTSNIVDAVISRPINPGNDGGTELSPSSIP